MPHSATSAQPRVVVVGAGFGGLEATRRLARSPVDVAVIDRHKGSRMNSLLDSVTSSARLKVRRFRPDSAIAARPP
jgi:NADH:ubiquinone reductase (H+-translocating)